jgi:hypothetical protein
MFWPFFIFFLLSYAWLAYGLFCGLRCLYRDNGQNRHPEDPPAASHEAALLAGLGAMALALTPPVVGLLMLPFYAGNGVPAEGVGRALIGALPALAGSALVALSRSVFPIKTPPPSPLRQAFAHLIKRAVSTPPEKWLFITLALYGLGMAVQGISLPLMESDALEYQAVSRLIYTSLNLHAYPVAHADPVLGLYAPSAHPPLFHLALVWGMQLCGVETTLPMRLITLFSALSTLAMVWALGMRVSRLAGTLSALLLICTPLWFSMSVSFNIDPVRIGVFMAAFMGVVQALEHRTRTCVVLAGVLSALAMWTHAIGLLAPVLGCAALALIGATRKPSRDFFSRVFPARDVFTHTALFAGVAFSGGVGWFAVSAFLGGHPFSDSWPAAQWPFLHFEADLRARRFLDTPFSVLIHGVFRALSEPALFGLTFWCAIGGLLLTFRAHPSKREIILLHTARLFMLGFFILALAGVSVDSLSLVKNPRYVMTLTPIVALLGGSALAHLLQGKCQMHRQVLGACIIALSLTWGVTSFLVRGQGLMDMGAVLSRDEMRFRHKPRLPGGSLLAQLEQLPEGRVLTFRQAEVSFYSPRPWIDHFDPRLKDVHTQNPQAAAQSLLDMGVRYVLTPPYTPVSLGQSSLGNMLADPAFITPLHEHRGTRLWALSPLPHAYTCTPLPLETKLTTVPSGLFTHLARLTGIPHLSHWADASARTTRNETLPALLQSSLQQTQILSFQWLSPSLPPPTWLKASLTLEGQDLVNIDAEIEALVTFEEGTRRLIQKTVRLFDGIPSSTSPRTLHMQWKAAQGETLRRLVIQGAERGWGSGTGHLKILNVEVCAISR